ncbi:MAG: hypothetical protein U0802_04640 [Candidatus Binatia bacterium]
MGIGAPRMGVVLAAALALMTGCAGSGGDGPRPTATAAPSATATAVPTATDTRTQTATPSGTALPSATSTPTAVDSATPSATPTATPDLGVVAQYADRGPYPVGVTTLNIGDRDIEVWYPLDPGSEVGAEKASYAAFSILPEAIQKILPPDLNLVVAMDAYRDLPISRAGPFPILTFSHGAGGFRQAYSGFLTGVASHGFVVASLDHLEWGLLAQVGLLPPGINRSAAEIVLAAVSRLTGASADPASPLAGGVAATRVITSGHSAGGRAAFALPDHPEVRAMIGFATGDSASGVSGKPILLLAGSEDGGLGSLERTYDDLSAVKRFVAIDRAGHNSFTDQCAIIYGGNNFLQRLVEAGFPLPPALLAQAIDGCRPQNIPPAQFWRVAQHFTVAHARAALGLDHPPVGLGAGVAGAFDGLTLRYRLDDDPGHPPADVQGFVAAAFASVVPSFAAGACPGGFNLSNVDRQTRGLPLLADDCANPEASADPDFQIFSAPGRSTDATSTRWSRAATTAALRPRRLRRPARRAGLRPAAVARGRLRARLPGGRDRRHGRRPGSPRRVDDGPDRGARRRRLASGRRSAGAGVRQPRRPAARRQRQRAALRHAERPSRRALSQPGRPRHDPRRRADRRADGRARADQHPDRRRRPDFRHAWIRLAHQPDGSVRGQIFGYQPIEEFYDIFGRKAGQAGAGGLGYTCTGLHAALVSQADGDYDAASGRCTSLSTGYQLTAVPAFIAR